MNVVMMHSVGNNDSDWHERWLSLPLRQFEYFCRYLVRKGYRTAHLDEWYGAWESGTDKDPTLVFLTFDDGYLDNWTLAAPILKKYGLVGTVFVNPEFVDPSKGCRPSLEEVWKRNLLQEELPALGFMNWDEIRALDRSGILDVQSHSMSHNYYFQSDQLIDIYTGQSHYHWLPWISHPERKYAWLTEKQEHLVPHGTPIFQYGRALGLRRYLPDPVLNERGQALIIEGRALEEVLGILKQELQRFPGRMESDEEMKDRFRYELGESKQILERELSKRVDYLCWPGGGYRKESLELAVEAGYKASTIASREANTQVDNSGPYKRIRRFGLSAGIRGHKGYYPQKHRRWTVQVFNKGKGSIFHIYLLVLMQRLILMREKWTS